MSNFEGDSLEKEKKGFEQIISILLNFFNKTENTNQKDYNNSQPNLLVSTTGKKEKSNPWLEQEGERISEMQERLKNLEKIDQETLSLLKKIKDDLEKDLKNTLSPKQENLIKNNIVPFQ